MNFSYLKSIKTRVFTVLITFGLFVSSGCAQSDKSSRDALYLKNFYTIYNYLQQYYVDEVDPKTLYEGALKGMMESLGDPYTVYLDVQDMRGLSDTTSGNFYGVGLSISKMNKSTPDKPAYVDVVSPIENTPGYKAGIQSGDKIIEIDGDPTPEMSMEEVLSRLRGEKGTPVEVTILRGKTATFKRTLIRDLIQVPTVEFTKIGNIGYVKLIQFTPETAPAVEKAIKSFDSEEGYKGLIIDLRNNPGGLLDSAVNVADKFIDSGVIVSTKSRIQSENKSFSASKKTTIVKKDVPIIVLINRGSASASEILAGALKDYHIGYLVGERTYGKGSVQQVLPLREIDGTNDGVKLTVAKYYSPSDCNINKIGIPPDREIKFTEYTDDQTKSFIKMTEDEVIPKYVEAHPGMTEKEIAEYASVLQKEYNLDLRLLRRLIRVETNRTKKAPLYDLDYDVQLNEAISIINKENFASLVSSTKTLKELQEEAGAEEEKKESSKTE
ncbi:MAG: S41 family peptidase [Treponema sp.]|uniref:S41 family peptidase n=1 Tax=Treponema sp. TaxID=166 RepID=UPI001B534341|nr:S41 family peptidase [Treponema sp.]MBP5403295.1 S41 family peptidase [Treponema sp.]MBR5932661.1 S41 family peptidase [Treponema sp.]